MAGFFPFAKKAEGKWDKYLKRASHEPSGNIVQYVKEIRICVFTLMRTNHLLDHMTH